MYQEENTARIVITRSFIGPKSEYNDNSDNNGCCIYQNEINQKSVGNIVSSHSNSLIWLSNIP